MIVIYLKIFASFCCSFAEKFYLCMCVFHSIRFKVNKGWGTAVSHFFCIMPNELVPERPFYRLHADGAVRIDRRPNGCECTSFFLTEGRFVGVFA